MSSHGCRCGHRHRRFVHRNNRSTRLPTSMQRIKEHGCHLPSSFLPSNFSTVKSAPDELMEKEEHHHVSCTSDVVLVQTLMCKPTLSELRLEGLVDSGLWKQRLKLHDQQRRNCPRSAEQVVLRNECARFDLAPRIQKVKMLTFVAPSLPPDAEK